MLYVQRENGFNPTEGFDYENRWVVRNENGDYVYHSPYRNDIFLRFGKENMEVIDGRTS